MSNSFFAPHESLLAKLMFLRFFPAILVLSAMTLITLTPSDLYGQQLGEHERIVFLGDSITQSGAGPDGYITMVRSRIAERLPEASIDVIGAGISGNKVPDLQTRLENDVLRLEPTVVFVYIGINDVWHSQSGRGTSKEDFETGLKDIIAKTTATGARVILCTASVIGEKTDGSNELDGMLDEYCQISREVAAETGVGLLDLRSAFIEELKVANPDNSAAGVLTTDGVHLNEAGNRFVAEQMLGALGLGADAQPQVADAESGKFLRHVVLFQFQDDQDQAAIDEVVREFGTLRDQVDTIIGYENGTNISAENLAQGYTHCFMVTFADEAGRDAYLPHPAHQKFVELLDGKIEKVCVVDFWSE